MELKVEVKTAGWQKKINRLSRLPEHLRILTEHITMLGLQNLKLLTPRSQNPGRHLADMWDADIKVKGSSAYIRLYNKDRKRLNIIRHLEYGTRAHAIPTEKMPPGRWMRFEWLGRIVFAKQVMNPGTKAHHMIRDTRKYLTHIWKEVKDRLVRSLRGAQ